MKSGLSRKSFLKQHISKSNQACFFIYKGGQMIHQIKISNQFFDDVQSGKKNFELRKDDREYQVGDTLFMREIADGILTGRTIQVKVIYKLTGYVGLESGYCILGIERLVVDYE